MTSKHYRWQLRWRIDRAAGLAVHDSGVTLAMPAATPLDCEPALAAMLAKNGPHNMPKMMQRLAREARELYGTADAR